MLNVDIDHFVSKSKANLSDILFFVKKVIKEEKLNCFGLNIADDLQIELEKAQESLAYLELELKKP